MDPGQRLDQGRFAGAVVAEQAQDLAGVHIHRDVLERDDAAEVFADLARLDQRRVVRIGHQ
jgi:hypothetical protein